MIVFKLTILFLQILISTTQEISNIRYNSLISAQCKARCLYEYRTYHQQQRSLPSMFIDGKTKRLLSTNILTLPWRSIWERCPRLITCSSLKSLECEQSCIFIQKLYRQQLNCLTDNCQSCSLSNDCMNKIPQIYNVTAIERKSRRTVKLKWKSNGEKILEPIFYVIEAQWMLSNININPYELVSKWGFVKEEVSHTKAIIRNIQRDNRWYKFRVAAVTRHGYSTFSMTNKPFRLTNQSQTVSPILDRPQKFSIKDYQLNFDTINVTLHWQKPDLPVNGYQISWELDNDQSSLVNSIDISSSLSSMEFTIPFLSLDKSYLFKIRSIIIAEGDHIQTSLPIIINFNYENESLIIKNLYISKPYFINGLIKTNISWNKILDQRLKQYDIYWIEHECHSDVLSCCYRRDAVTIQNSFQLYDLRYNCTYLITIQPIGLKQKNTFKFYFNVSSCELTDVYGSIRPPCQTDRRTIDTFSSLPPIDLIVTRNQSGLILLWQNVQSFVNDVFYLLNIVQLPSQLEIISVKLHPIITDYFIPYSIYDDNRYLNVTLSLIDKITIRQQQSILISIKQEEYLNRKIINSSSSSLIITNYFRYLLLFVIFILYSNNND
ncbi:unnamed protein product [Adineta steineri]|uniref:Uncharacterized protein n=1 Tax=Adineta steineri TaxID=433720 RepID=A0A818WVJ5_9BILA|nr:unnamed protein product [Adineta steineri]